MTSLPSNQTTSVGAAVVMTCEEFVNHVTDLLREIDADADTTTGSRHQSPDELQHDIIRHVIASYISPSICSFGVIGNILNLVVLTRKRLQRSMKHLERSVTNGLAALAISDMFFCLINLVLAVYGDKSTYDSLLELYIRTYKEPLINFFLLTSTWLTVVLAFGRYIAVCHPLHARWFINLRGTRIAIATVFVGSLFINLPGFWHYSPSAFPCSKLDLNVTVVDYLSTQPKGDEGALPQATSTCECSYYLKLPGRLYYNRMFTSAYRVTCSTVAIFIPLSVLVVCNWCLVQALRRSSAMQRRCCRVVHTPFATTGATTAVGSVQDLAVPSGTCGPRYGPKAYTSSPSAPTTGHRITPTLVALIVMFIVLVIPSEILTFIGYVSGIQHQNIESTDDVVNATISSSPALSTDVATSTYFRFRSAVEVTNCLLLVNFAFNVVLYCAINAHFRRVMHHVFCGVLLRRRRPPMTFATGGETGAGCGGQFIGCGGAPSGTEVMTMWVKSNQVTAFRTITTEADLDAL